MMMMMMMMMKYLYKRWKGRKTNALPHPIDIIVQNREI